MKSECFSNRRSDEAYTIQYNNIGRGKYVNMKHPRRPGAGAGYKTIPEKLLLQEFFC